MSARRRSGESDTSHITNEASILAPLETLLGQLAWVLRRLEDSHYCAQQARGISGSVGGHVRHCLDHISALTSGVARGQVSYDHRRRGTAVESCRAAALLELQRVARDLKALPAHDLDRPLVLRAALDTGGAPVRVSSTVGRELVFVVSHTIHHLAMIALLLRDFSIDVPPRFGYAPTTPTETATAA
jgi:hypothetical protein